MFRVELNTLLFRPKSDVTPQDILVERIPTLSIGLKDPPWSIALTC